MTTNLKLKTPPFKKFDCTRKKVFLLPPAAFKVWMFHYSMEGPDKTKGSYPKLETISEALNMDEKLIKKQRRALLLHGWLKKIGEKQNTSSGKFNVPIMMADEGIIPEGDFYPKVKHKHPGSKHPSVAGSKHPSVQGQNTPLDRGSKRPSEVDSENQVDTLEENTEEVEGFAEPFSNLFPNSKAPIEAGSLEQIQVPQGQNTPTVKPEGQNAPTVEPEAPAEPFAGMTVSEVLRLIPLKEGIVFYNKYDKGHGYNAHRAEIVAYVLEYQRTHQEVVTA